MIDELSKKTWISLPVARPHHVVASSPKYGASSSPDTGVKQPLHEPVSRIVGSTLSWPTSLRA